MNDVDLFADAAPEPEPEAEALPPSARTITATLMAALERHYIRPGQDYAGGIFVPEVGDRARHGRGREAVAGQARRQACGEARPRRAASQVPGADRRRVEPRAGRAAVNPDCATGKHRACSGDGWDETFDAWTPCPCPCHGGGAG